MQRTKHIYTYILIVFACELQQACLHTFVYCSTSIDGCELKSNYLIDYREFN